MNKLVLATTALAAFAASLSPASAAYYFAITDGDSVTRFTIDDPADGAASFSDGTSATTEDTLSFFVTATTEEPGQIGVEQAALSFGDYRATNYFTFDRLAYGAFDSFLTGTGAAPTGFTLGTFDLLGTNDAVTLTITSDAQGAVPEPASWAMMVGGFGLLGGALRRQKASVSFA